MQLPLLQHTHNSFDSQIAKLFKFIKENVIVRSPSEIHSRLKLIRPALPKKPNLKTYLYELTNIMLRLLLENEDGSMITTLLFIQFCDKNQEVYWKLLHTFEEQKGNITECLMSSQAVSRYRMLMTKRQQEEQLISFAQNLLYKYECSCSFRKRIKTEEIMEEESQKKQMERCPVCLSIFHPQCQSQPLLCQKCYSKENTFETRTIEMMSCNYLQPQSFITVVKFKCPNIQSAQLSQSTSFDVRIRLIMNSQMYQIKEHLPLSFNLYVNSQILRKFKLKSQEKMAEIKIPLRFLQANNTLVIKNQYKLSRKREPLPLYISEILQNPLLLGVVRVVPRNKKKDVLANSYQKFEYSDLERFYSEINIRYFREKEKQVRITRTGNLNKIMQIPCRGFDCIHFECFDYNEVKCEERRSRCPVCNRIITSVYIDKVFEEYICCVKGKRNGFDKFLTLEFDRTSLKLKSIEQMKGNPETAQIIID